MIRYLLMLLFVVMLVGMVTMTIVASMDRGIAAAGRELVGDHWFQATLLDAYFAFVTFYVWVAYKETSWLGRIAWFVLIMFLGTIAISVYVLIRLIQLPKDASISDLLTREPLTVR